MPQTASSPRTSGFTLLEVLITIAALAILAAVTLPQFNRATLQSKEANALSNLGILRQAIEHYRHEHGDMWPSEDIEIQLTGKTGPNGGTLRPRFGPYIRQQFPLNPITGSRIVAIVDSMPEFPLPGAGWIYCPTTGEIRLNAMGLGPSGVTWFSM
jgi:prepilin-type N-terminal cleavage/methylation domain-containing protein